MKVNLTLFRNDVLPVYTTSLNNKVVDGRELHSFLGVGKVYGAWIKDIIKKHGFVENQEYLIVKPDEILIEGLLSKNGKQKKTAHNRVDYIFQLAPAKKIAMGTNNAQGDRVKDYFLECERIAHAPLAANAIPTPFLEHTKHEVQINNVKAHAKAAYEIGGKDEIIKRHTEVTLALTHKTPRQLKEEAKAQGIPYKHRKSGREYMRYQYPCAACTASVIDELGSNGVPIESLLPGIPKLNDAFAFILDMGLIPRELNT